MVKLSGSFEGLLEDGADALRAILKGCWRAISMISGSFEGLLAVPLPHKDSFKDTHEKPCTKQ